MKICPVGAELFHAGGRTDMTKLMFALPQKEFPLQYRVQIGLNSVTCYIS